MKYKYVTDMYEKMNSNNTFDINQSIREKVNEKEITTEN